MNALRTRGDEEGLDTGSGVGIVAAAAKVGNWTNKDDDKAVTAYESQLLRSATDPKWCITHQCWLEAVGHERMHTLNAFRSHLLQLVPASIVTPLMPK